MKRKLLLTAFTAVLLTSCSTYKAGQTPDDVYYSPAKEYVVKEEKEVRRDRYDEYIASEDDRYLRMKIQNRDRWSGIDDYTYWNDSRYFDCNSVYVYNNFSYNNRYGYNNNYFNNYGSALRYNNCIPQTYRTNYFGHAGYYSPGYPVVYYKSPKVYSGSTGKINLGAYRNPTYNNTNYGSKGANQNNLGNLMKRVFSESNTNTSSGTSWERPVRTIEPGTSTNSNAGGKSGGYNSTGTSTPAKRDPRN